MYSHLYFLASDREVKAVIDARKDCLDSSKFQKRSSYQKSKCIFQTLRSKEFAQHWSKSLFAWWPLQSSSGCLHDISSYPMESPSPSFVHRCVSQIDFEETTQSNRLWCACSVFCVRFQYRTNILGALYDSAPYSYQRSRSISRWGYHTCLSHLLHDITNTLLALICNHIENHGPLSTGNFS